MTEITKNEKKILKLIKMTKKIGVVGGSGYTGGELIRILVNHPNVEIDFVYSRTNDGKKIQDIHSDLIGKNLPFFSKKIFPYPHELLT